VRLEELGKMKKKIHLIGTGTRDIIVPQPTTLLRAPNFNINAFYMKETVHKHKNL
jgi:hypothetical protein